MRFFGFSSLQTRFLASISEKSKGGGAAKGRVLLLLVAVEGQPWRSRSLVCSRNGKSARVVSGVAVGWGGEAELEAGAVTPGAR